MDGEVEVQVEVARELIRMLLRCVALRWRCGAE